MLGSLDIVQQYSNTGRVRVGGEWSGNIYLSPAYTLSGRPKEGENTFGPQQARLYINKGLHRDLCHKLLSPGTKSCQKHKDTKSLKGLNLRAS